MIPDAKKEQRRRERLLGEHYVSIGKSILKSLHNQYGDHLRAVFTDDVRRQLITAEALSIMLRCARDGMTARELADHGHKCLHAALVCAGLEGE